jgi:hypothetical protein
MKPPDQRLTAQLASGRAERDAFGDARAHPPPADGQRSQGAGGMEDSLPAYRRTALPSINDKVDGGGTQRMGANRYGFRQIPGVVSGELG